MKNFNFKIIDIYSILSKMDIENRNMDSFLDYKIKHSLMNATSEDFSSELIKRLNLEKEFVKEDIKTFKIAKFISAGFIAAMLLISVVLGLIINSNQKTGESSFFGNLINSFAGFIELISVKVVDIFGLSFTPQTLIVILLLMVFVFVFSFVDKMIFRKTL